MGIDVNAKHIAVSIITPKGKVLLQTYFGKHIWAKRKKIIERRSFLQSVNAKQKIKSIKHYEKNFVETNLAQSIKQMVSLAVKYDSSIAIENLHRFAPKGRSFNRKIMRIRF